MLRNGIPETGDNTFKARLNKMTALSRPRIHWVSPLPPAETDIAHYTQRILAPLSDRADVILWTDAPRWDSALEKICTVRRFNPDKIMPVDFTTPRERMSEDEAIFVAIGNSWSFHSGLMRLCHRIPSIVVLHDLAIQELCRDAISNGVLNEVLYLQEMYRWYGKEGADLARKFLKGHVSAYDLSAVAPGFEVALGRAVSIVTHTSVGFETLKSLAYLPSYQLNLPFLAKPKATVEREASGPLRFVQFGYIGPNRRLEQVLDVLSGLRTFVDFQFDVVGKVWDAELINRRIRELDLQDVVRLHGFVEEAELDKMLGAAHLVFNLRYPTMGEASGSQLRVWNSGSAAVVTEQGWYSSIPEGSVFRVSVENEAQDLRNLILKLSKSRKMGESVGKSGREHLLQSHGVDRYAEEIVSVARRFKADARSALLAHSVRSIDTRHDNNRNIYFNEVAKLF